MKHLGPIVGVWIILFCCVFAVGAEPIAKAEKPTEGEQSPFYDPIEKTIEGWTIAVDPKLFEEENAKVREQAFKALANHLQRVEFILPQDRLTELKTIRIWLDLDHPKIRGMQYHPNRGWLMSHEHDPRLVKHVHIPQAKELSNRQMWAKHPYVVLHELAHGYHDQFLDFDHAEIVATFKQAKEQGLYEDVLLYTGKKVRHYALTNHKEYFAESTEAYFGVNDFYPFVRAELREHDPKMHALLEKIWGPVR